MTASPPIRYAGAALAAALGGYALLGGLTSFLGWPVDVPRLTDWFNDDVSIQPNACVLLMLSGAAVMFAQSRAIRAILTLGALVGVGGALILLQYIVGADFGFNHQLLFGRSWGQGTTLTPGRVGPPASTSFTLTGIALVLLAVAALQPRCAHLRRLVPMLGVAVCVIMAFSLLGYLYGAREFYTIPWLTAIALQTATMLFAVGLGLVVSVPEHQPMLLLREHSGAGALSRIALPALVVMIPLVLWLRIWGYEQGHYDLGTGRTVGALTLVVGSVAVLWIALLALRRHEETLRHHSQQLETLIDRAPLGVYLVDADFRIRKANPVALPSFGDIPGGVVGRDFDEIIHILWDQDYADEVVQIFRHTLETGEPYFTPERAEYRIDRKKTEYYEWRLDRIAMPDGRYGLVCYFRDISQQVEARHEIEQSRDALQEADRRKDEFLATLAHELRNPLAPVMNSLAILDGCGGDETIAVEARAIMWRQMKQMVRLIDDLLDVSRISRGTITLQKERLVLQSVVQQTIESVGPLSQAAQQRLAVHLPPRPVWIEADPVRLAQIISNLLSNASRYSAPGSEISLHAEHAGSEILLRVKDQGLGIPSDKLNRIFDMFSQLDRSLERRSGGLGIGLYLVKRLVEMHGGIVTAHSEGPGTGSEFVVRLPIVTERPSVTKSPAPCEPDAMPRPAGRSRILVVDDNVDAATTMATLLRAQGYGTETAHDGLQAVEIAERFNPDVILLDIGLPALNGYEACRRIRSRPWGREMVLIAVTGWGQEENKRRAQESGFDAHLVKPVEPPKLLELLALLLEKQDQSHVPVALSADSNGIISAAD